MAVLMNMFWAVCLDKYFTETPPDQVEVDVELPQLSEAERHMLLQQTHGVNPIAAGFDHVVRTHGR